MNVIRYASLYFCILVFKGCVPLMNVKKGYRDLKISEPDHRADDVTVLIQVGEQEPENILIHYETLAIY